MLQHMLSVYNSAKPPDPPSIVQLDIASSHSLTVRFSEPKKDNGSPVTRYRGIEYCHHKSVTVICVVEWSKCYDFAVVEGSFVLSDLTYKLDPHSNSMEYTIPDLESVSNIFLFIWYACYMFLYRVKNILCVFQHQILRGLVRPLILYHLEQSRAVSVYMCQ